MQIQVTPTFQKEFKKLNKKSHTLLSSLQELKNILLKNPEYGISLGKNFFKIRLVSDYSGKSGGYRVITYYVKGKKIILTSVYQKSHQSSVSVQKLKKIINEL